MTPDDTWTPTSVDTNIFISSLISLKGPPAGVADAFRAGRFLLITSSVQREEFGQVLLRPRLRAQLNATDYEIAGLLTMIDQNAVFVEQIPSSVPLVRDPKDQMILATAIAGGAHFLVTGDADLLVLATHNLIGDLRIVTPAAFLEFLAATT
jgi:uncharacterized protein